MFWNEYDIDETYDIIARRAPEAEPYARYLRDWKDIVNQNSDGWAHWSGGHKAADKLCTLLRKVVDNLREGGSELPSKREFTLALSPIKSTATRRNLPAPELQEVAAPAPGR